MSCSKPMEKQNKSKEKEGSRGISRRQRSADLARIRFADEDKKRSKQSTHQIRKEPRQQRSKQMVQAILQAAAELFAQFGYARTTTNKIAERAGVSVGSLYQYFPNKDCLLASLQARHQDDVGKVVGAALERLADPETRIEIALRQLLSDLVALHQADPNLTKALSSAVLRESPSVEEPHKGENDLSQGRHLSALLASRPDVRDGDHLAMAAVLGQTTAQLTRWLVHAPPAGVKQADLLEEMVQLLVLYLEK